jgi:drug/metabolite transporter (DMT)-like permease
VRADVALALCSLFWGATFVTVKSALDYSSVFVFLAVRFSLAAILMAAFRPAVFRSLGRADWIAGGVLGAFLFGGYTFQTAGLLYTSPAKSAFVTGSSVVMVPLFLGIFWRRGAGRRICGGVLAALAGLYLLTVPAAGISHLNRGDVFTLVAAALYAVHIILVGDSARSHPVAALAVLQIAACGILAAIAALAAHSAGWQAARFEWRWELYVAIIICAIIATAIAFSMQLWAQQYTSPSHAAILFTLEPVFAAITSYLWLHERLGPRAMAGAALVFAGILLAELAGTALAAESPEPAG